MQPSGSRAHDVAHSYSGSDAMTLLRQINARSLKSLPHKREAGALRCSLPALVVAQSDRIDPCLASKVLLALLQKNTSSTALRRGHGGEMCTPHRIRNG